MNGNHHYLPQFYLNGFVGENEKLYYCRKQYNTYKDVYPSGIYYKKGLNDIDFGEEGYFNLEKDFFMEKDNRYSQAINNMRYKYHYDIYSMPLQVKADIVEFVLGLWWRVPGGLQHVIDLFEHEGFVYPYADSEGHVYYNDDVPNIIKLMHKDDRYQKVFLPNVYNENIEKHNWAELDDKFFIFETYEPLLIGDIPYVPLMTENKRGKILEEFMIPLDKNHILIYAHKRPSFLETNLLYLFNLCVVYGASEKIVCSNLDYLKEKRNMYMSVIERFQKLGIDGIKDKLLPVFIEFQSHFKSFEDFEEYYNNTDFSKYATTEVISRILKKYS